MPQRYSPMNTLADDEERFISRAVEQERQQMVALYGATAGAGVGETDRPRRVSDELLGMGDQATIARVKSYGDFMDASEREAVDRRAIRAGGQPVFADTTETN